MQQILPKNYFQLCLLNHPSHLQLSGNFTKMCLGNQRNVREFHFLNSVATLAFGLIQKNQKHLGRDDFCKFISSAVGFASVRNIDFSGLVSDEWRLPLEPQHGMCISRTSSPLPCSPRSALRHERLVVSNTPSCRQSLCNWHPLNIN